MFNLVSSLLAGAAVFAGLFFSHLLKWGEALVPAVIVVIGTMIVLGRRTLKQMEAVFEKVGKELQNQRFDAAVATMKAAYPLARKQIGMTSQLEAQIGMIAYVRKDFNGSIPYFERSKRLGHWVGVAMLAVAYYKKKDHAKMRETFELVVTRAKKQGLAWNLYAYCLSQIGDEEGAQAVLARGVKASENDKRVAENLIAMQNGKKIKMKGYAEQWYQFHLEAPPMQTMMDGRSMFSARRRR